MFCENCGHQISDTAKFCSACGHPVGTAPSPGAVAPPPCRPSQTRIAPAESLVWQWQHHENVRDTPETMAAPNADS